MKEIEFIPCTLTKKDREMIRFIEQWETEIRRFYTMEDTIFNINPSGLGRLTNPQGVSRETG